MRGAKETVHKKELQGLLDRPVTNIVKIEF